MLSDSQAFQNSKDLYLACKKLKLPLFLKDQLLRASSSVALNVAEGSGKWTGKDQKRFYSIAYGSLRECEAILELEQLTSSETRHLIDSLGRILFALCRPDSKPNPDSTLNSKPTNAKPKTYGTANKRVTDKT
ncbi:MAG: four helix bundle protein [Deltaproteobacteria bacterium]|nr:four helix bundle protein [Deltaproteobacteria bacterium]